MKNIGIFYGSSTGTTQEIAERIGESLGVDAAHIKDISDSSLEDFSNYDALLLGSATWGEGELQDDWMDLEDDLKDVDLSGKTVALFGCGDGGSFPDSFCGGMGQLHKLLRESGAKFIGTVASDGYDFSDSPSLVDGVFVGLAIDEANEYDKTDDRIAAWVADIKPELA